MLPFFLLLGRNVKGEPRMLGAVSLIVLVAHLVDLYWMLFPALGGRLTLGWPEACFALLFAGVGLVWLRRSMSWGADLPVGDPLLAEGLGFHL